MVETSLTLGRGIANPFDRSHFQLLALVCQAGYEALMHLDEAATSIVAECERENDVFGGVYLFRGHCLALRGTLATRRGDLSQAASLLAESLGFYRAIDSIFDIAGSLVQLGFLALRRGQPHHALQLFKESLPLHGTYTLSPWVTRGLAHLTIALAACRSWRLAARLAGSLGIEGAPDHARAADPTVISSAVAIPSAAGLPEPAREFVVYESSLSDIVGVLVMYAWMDAEGALGAFAGSLVGSGVLSLVAAAFAAVALFALVNKLEGHVRFLPLLAGLVLLYAVGKEAHLSPLIMVLVCGLLLNNPHLLERNRGRSVEDVLSELRHIYAQLIGAFWPGRLNLHLYRSKQETGAIL